MVKIIIGALLALISANTIAGNMYVYKDKDGQVLLINVNPSGSSHRSTKEANIHIDDETTAYEKKLVEARKQLAEQHLKNMQTNREKGIRVSNKDEVLYSLNDYSEVNNDVGAKIGMTKEQVLNQTHWRLSSPTYVHKVDDKRGELEQWYYHNKGALYFDNGKLSSIQIFR